LRLRVGAVPDRLGHWLIYWLYIHRCHRERRITPSHARLRALR
jgi:hypothetical protein